MVSGPTSHPDTQSSARLYRRPHDGTALRNRGAARRYAIGPGLCCSGGGDEGGFGRNLRKRNSGESCDKHTPRPLTRARTHGAPSLSTGPSGIAFARQGADGRFSELVNCATTDASRATNGRSTPLHRSRWWLGPYLSTTGLGGRCTRDTVTSRHMDAYESVTSPRRVDPCAPGVEFTAHAELTRRWWLRDVQRAQARAPAAAASAAGHVTDHRMGVRTRAAAVGPTPPGRKEAATAGVAAGNSSGGQRRRARSHRTRAADQDGVQTAGGGMSKVRRGLGDPSESTEVTATGQSPRHCECVVRRIGVLGVRSRLSPSQRRRPGVLPCSSEGAPRAQHHRDGQSIPRHEVVVVFGNSMVLPTVATPPVWPSVAAMSATAMPKPVVSVAEACVCVCNRGGWQRSCTMAARRRHTDTRI